MDSFGVRPFPKYTAERNNGSSQYEHEKVIKKRIGEGISYPVRSPKSLPSSSSKLVCRLEIDPAEPCFRPSLASFVLQEKEREKELILFSGELVVKMPIWGVGLTAWLKTKVVDPLMQIIRRGAEPKQLAFSTALGVTLGVFPICGTTVLLCGAAIGLIGNRCHAPSVMLANFVATPIELSLVVPFLRLGEVISGGPHFPLTSDALMKVVTGEASRDVLISVLHALLGWIVAAPFILGALYVVFIPCFKFLISRFNAAPSSPKKQRAI
nr:PREDICTED: uncharacterized protein LOC103997465 isoform X1 [Musa acuminata subsp. malaccensis]